MSGIFISYRHEEGAGRAGRLFDRLVQRFGNDRVFMDVADIEPGVDFVEAIERAVGSCDVLIAVIGDRWLNCVDDEGRRRLDVQDDFVRLEIGSALKRQLRLIPILISGARMPSAAQLPEELARLSTRQALEISDTRWDYDTGHLIEVLEKVIDGGAAPSRSGHAGAPTPTKRAATFDPDQVKKVDYRTWKYTEELAIDRQAAFDLCTHVLKELGIKIKDTDPPGHIVASKGLTSGWSSLITGGEEIVIYLESVGPSRTAVSVASRSNGSNLIDPLSTNKRNIQTVVEAILAGV